MEIKGILTFHQDLGSKSSQRGINAKPTNQQEFEDELFLQ